MALETTLRWRRLGLAWIAVCTLAPLGAGAGGTAADATGSRDGPGAAGSRPRGAAGVDDWRADSLEALVGRFRQMPGLQARFEEEKSIALLERPLRSSGQLAFVPPQLLVRRVDWPTPSLLRLDGDRLLWADASGSERLDLGANPTARAFARTFTDVLAGDLPRLRASYEISFRPQGSAPASAWRIDLTPRDDALARAISSISIEGRGVAPERLWVREASGDATVTRFHDVDPDHRFDEAEIARLLRPPSP